MSSKYNLVKRPEKKDEDDDDDFKDEDEIEVEVEEKSSKSNNSMRKRMFLFMGVIVAITILLLFILFIGSLAKGRKVYTFNELESVLVSAAKSYFKDHPEQLPEDDGDIVEIDSSNLVVAGKMNNLSEYLDENTICSGTVQVEKSGSEYLYSPYLNCGDSYISEELYKRVIKNNDVTDTGYGLYQMNNEYVFRGEIVDNYVQLDEALWRILKITSDGEVVLVHDEGVSYVQPWDNRYNNSRNFESGINGYNASRVREYLDRIYNNPVEEDSEIFLSKNDKARLVSFNLCIGKRSSDIVSNDNLYECSDVLSNQKVGLLTLSDYMRASIDSTCTSAESRTCQNYNYLVKNFEWWVATANAKDDSTVFKIDRDGIISIVNASSYCKVRPVVYLNSKTMFKSGNGSIEKPYEVK